MMHMQLGWALFVSDKREASGRIFEVNGLNENTKLPRSHAVTHLPGWRCRCRGLFRAPERMQGAWYQGRHVVYEVRRSWDRADAAAGKARHVLPSKNERNELGFDQGSDPSAFYPNFCCSIKWCRVGQFTGL